PWEHEHFWKLRDGVEKRRIDFKVDWEILQRPGFSPDYNDQSYERMDLAFNRSDWIPTEAAIALIRNNRPLLAYVGGKTNAFTSKDHNFLPGETVEKQLIVINNSREPITCESRWKINLPTAVSGTQRITVGPGGQERIPVRFELPEGTSPRPYGLTAEFVFSNREKQTDILVINVLPPPKAATIVQPKIALFDPKGETRTALEKIGLRTERVDTATD